MYFHLVLFLELHSILYLRFIAIFIALSHSIENINAFLAFHTHRMFDSAVSFNQDLSGWNVNNVKSMNSMFQNATSFDQTLCWEELDGTATTAPSVQNMFCGSHSNARLDPCCILDATSLIEASCCKLASFPQRSGSCDTICSDAVDGEEEEKEEAGVEIVGNVVITPTDDVIGPEESNEVVNTPSTTGNTSSNTTTDINLQNEVNNLQGENANANNENNNDNNEESDKDIESGENKNAWDEYLWLRILVGFGIFLLVLNLVVYGLSKRRENELYERRAASFNNNNNNKNEFQAAAATSGSALALSSVSKRPGGAAAGPTKGKSLMKGHTERLAYDDDDDDDEENGTVQTKPTDENIITPVSSGIYEGVALMKKNET